ncbi:MAG: DUF3164 family protein [Desulfobulbaceae bacterium]|nr:DUF3164 family protein [Desulfobulbaceae bacterium]
MELMERWRWLFESAVAATGQAEVARALGYSPATVSQVAGNKYPGDLKAFGRKVIEVYGTKEDKMNVVPEGYMKNRLGHLVREADVPPIDLLRDNLAVAMVVEAEDLAALMASRKRRWLENMQALLQTAAEQYGVTNLEGKNGDFAIYSFSGAVKIERVHRKLMVVNETAAAIAKEMVDRVVDKLSDNLPANARRMVRAAFRRDEKGNYSATGLVALTRRVKLDDPEWQQAVAAINDAVATEYGEPYVRFYVLDRDGKTYRQIPLDLSTVMVAGEVA